MPQPLYAVGCITIHDNMILLTKEKNIHFWKFPHLQEPCEDIDMISGIESEILFEFGFEVVILEKKPFLMGNHNEAGRPDIVLVHYLCQPKVPPPTLETIRDHHWTSLEELKKQKAAPNMMAALEHFSFI